MSAVPLEPPSVSRETQSQFYTYEALLKKWQAAINLVAPDSMNDAMTRHFIDSAQLAALMPTHVKTLWDWGSGAGFPGMVLAMMRPDIEVHLVESDAKKCAFLNTVSRETGTAVTVHNTRIEQIDLDVKADLITARALASLEGLLRLALPWTRQNPDLRLLLPKGGSAEQELSEAQQNFEFSIGRFPSKTAPDACIFLIGNLAAKS